MTILRDLLSIFTSDHPLQSVSSDFSQMLTLARDMVFEANEAFWGNPQTPEARARLYAQDAEIAQIERRIRKQLIAHLVGDEPKDPGFCLLIMSLLKDAERLGDYAKNLSDVAQIASGPFPECSEATELREIASIVEHLVREAQSVFETRDVTRATDLTREGRGATKRCDEIVRSLARSDYKAPIVVALTLGARFYKRLGGHALNILSGVIMPLHKLDDFEEDPKAST